MSDESAREADGRWKPGVSGNPSGTHRWLQKVRKRLQKGSARAATYLMRVADGKETTYKVTKDGATVEVELEAKDRIMACKVILEYTVPKPKQELEVTTTPSPLEGIDREVLLQWAQMNDEG